MEQAIRLTPFLSVASQIKPGDVGTLAAQGYCAILNNRPDGEFEQQPAGAEIAAAAERHGLEYHHLPVKSGAITDEDVERYSALLQKVRGPVLTFCRTGTRSTTLWALSSASQLSPQAILRTTAEAGYDLEALLPRLEARWSTPGMQAPQISGQRTWDVLIVGGGAAGISTASGLLRRRPGLSVAIVEPRDKHYYQPGWTLVGGGVFNRAFTERSMARCMPKNVHWIHSACAAFEPQHNRIVLEDGSHVAYRTLVVCPGLELNWSGIEGLRETLGRNGVTSNYLFDMSAYTWELTQTLRSGRALFTQPPMPIKCAGAPQKAMYLSANHWERSKRLNDISIEFNTAGAALFGVADYVPPLMKYIERYNIDLAFQSRLTAVDGPARTAHFEVIDADGNKNQVSKEFDMLHAVPPQRAPKFIRESPLGNETGWVEVDAETLRHSRYGNIFGLGDVSSSPNAKTAAAVRKQVPVVAENLLAVLDGRGPRALYDGYGSCPLTVERGKIILAEFGYGGKLMPSFPWDSTVPRRSAWFLKEKLLPNIYWDLMLKGHEWFVKPKRLEHEPALHEAQDACQWEKRA